MALTLTANIGANDDLIPITGTVPADVVAGYEFRLGNELLAFQAFDYGSLGMRGPVDPQRWHVLRGLGGTVKATHTAGTTVMGAADTFASAAGVTPPSPWASGGGGAALTVTDGETTVEDVTTIEVTGATVSDEGGGVAGLAVSGGGGGGNVTLIDCGILDVRDLVLAGTTELVAAAAGRYIMSVRYGFEGFVEPVNPSIIYFYGNGGTVREYGYISGEYPVDTTGLFLLESPEAPSPNGEYGNTSAAISAGPLSAVASNPGGLGVPIGPDWQAEHAYSAGDTLVDSNDHLQVCTTPGESGADEPTWDTMGGTTSDGDAEWLDSGVMSSGAVQVFVEVVDIAP